MTEIAEFITARLDEAEAAITALPAEARGPWDASDNLIGGVQWVGLFGCDPSTGSPVVDLGRIADREVARYMVRYGPAWALADIAAKRASLAEHASSEGDDPVCGRCVFHRTVSRCRPVPWPCHTVKFLAAPYREHPDFRPEWSVT